MAGSRSAKDEAPSTSTKERKTSSSEGKKRTTAKDDKEVKPKVRFWLFVNAKVKIFICIYDIVFYSISFQKKNSDSICCSLFIL